MPIQDEYKVDLEVFEGPLDLLLYLIKKEEVDIYNIPIEKITTQYLEYMNLMRMLDLNIAGEFLVMAATLMMIKSRMLLPPEERTDLDEEEEQDPRWDLVRQLIEYKKFKDAANHLQELEGYQENVFRPHQDHDTPHAEEGGIILQDLSLFDLISAFREILRRAPAEQIGQIYGDQFTVADKIDNILQTLRHTPRVSFFSLFIENSSRHEIICTFLAILELIRLRQIAIHQPEHFADINIEMAAPRPAAEIGAPAGQQETAPDIRQIAEGAVENPC